MKIPRDCNGADLKQALKKFGYVFDRQTGSHITVTTQQNGEHHVTFPNHHPIKVSTLHDTLKAVASQHKISVDELLRELRL